jgi:O-antigen/teichoic acid export membrane protein
MKISGSGKMLSISLASIASGLISYLFVFVGSRVIETTDMSQVLAFWAMSNTLVLAFAIPLDTIAPKFIARPKTSDIEVSFVLHGLAISAVVLFLFILLSILKLHSYFRGYEIVGSLFVLSLGFWSGVRAVFVGRADFTNFLKLTIANSFIALAGLIVVFAYKNREPQFLLLPIAAGNLLAAGIGFSQILVRRNNYVRPKKINFNLGKDAYKMASALVLATGVSLTMNNGGIALAPILGASPDFVIAFAAVVSLVQVPMMLLNNLSLFVNIRMTRWSEEGQREKILSLYYQTLLFFFACTCLILTLTFFLSPLGISFFVSEQFHIARTTAVLAAAGVCIDWLTVMPRLLGLALGRATQIWKVWTAGSISYIAVFFTPIQASSQIIAAPIIGGVVILAFGTISIKSSSST